MLVTFLIVVTEYISKNSLGRKGYFERQKMTAAEKEIAGCIALPREKLRD